VVGLKSKTHVVIAGLMKASDDLSGFQKKIFKIDDHIGIGFCGLIADGRSLTKTMRQECLRYKFGKEAPMTASRLCSIVSSKSQQNTQQYGRRPYGVGVIVGSYDLDEPHIYYLCPSGNTFDYVAHAMGARSQSAKTYLEKTYEQYESATTEDLIRHALRSIRESVQDKDKGLTVDNCVVCVVGKDTPFGIIPEDQLSTYLQELEAAGGGGGSGSGSGSGDDRPDLGAGVTVVGATTEDAPISAEDTMVN